MENNVDDIFDSIKNIFQRDGSPPEHPNCRCRIMIFIPYITKRLVYEYITECKKNKIWEN